ncbi:hypothetical protein RIF29_31641 [Crotalaria pallida]|uniref:Uncharacterized protein n=1 Tax=Crotalaria pallida TaxID=3830 RepID=A0AAN9EHW1_CROPI
MFSNQFVLSFSLFFSLSIIILLAPHLLPHCHTYLPISPQDELEDLYLFNNALSLSHSPPSPNKPYSFFHLSSIQKPIPNKIAFLFLTNTPLHFAPLWNSFFLSQPTNLYNVYVHADPSMNITHQYGVFRGRFIVSKPTSRASPTLISATRRLLATALLDDPNNMYFALISQHCIPLHSFPYVYNSLFNSKTFDKSKPSQAPLDAQAPPSYKSYIEILDDSPKLWQRYAARGRFTMMPEVPFEEFKAGSQFLTLTRRHALTVVKDRALWRKFKVPCYRDDECYPEEHYFPTLLSMKDAEGCTKYTLTRVNWTGSVNGHPYTYRPEHVTPQLIHRLRESNHSESYLFARKFSPDCLEPLMRIAKSVIFSD